MSVFSHIYSESEDFMKKIFAILLVVMLIASMAVPVFAVTPPLEAPDLPEIPDISDDVKIELPNNFWNNWFKNHPLPKFIF